MKSNKLIAVLQRDLTSKQLEALVQKTTLADLLTVNLPGAMDPELKTELVHLQAQLEILTDRLDRQNNSNLLETF